MKQIRLNDTFPNWMQNGGIFSYLVDYEVPWTENIEPLELNLEYHGNVSGEKIVSPLVKKMLVDGELTESVRQTLASVIFSIYAVNWLKEWYTQSYDYNPIDNYSMTERLWTDVTVSEYGKRTTQNGSIELRKTGTETDTPNINEVQTNNLSHVKTGNENTNTSGNNTISDNTNEVETPNRVTNIQNSVHGFNSNIAVPSTEQTGNETGSTTKTKSGTQTTVNSVESEIEYDLVDRDTGTINTQKTGTNEHEYDTTENNTNELNTINSGSDKQTRNYRLTRKGNIGVTTTQDMIMSERNLWMWNFFHEVVFPDIDKILTLKVY